MKLQIDTKEKTIKVDTNVKFNELIKVLDKLLPKEWKEYTLESNSTIVWGTYPVHPWTLREPWVITCGTSYIHSDSANIGSIYNVEVAN